MATFKNQYVVHRIDTFFFVNTNYFKEQVNDKLISRVQNYFLLRFS